MPWGDDVTLIVEMGFASGPYVHNPVWTNVTTYVRGMVIDRGRSSFNSEFGPGTLTLTLDNTDGRFDPNNSSSPYDPDLKLGVQVRVRATHSVTTYNLWRGHVDDWGLDYPSHGKDAVAVLGCVDNLAIVRKDELTAQVYAQEKSHIRLQNIFADAGWPEQLLSIDDAGILEVAAATFTGSPSQIITETLQAEQGNLFVDGAGDVTWKTRIAFSGASSQATYDPGINLDYMTVSLSYDDDTLINKVSVTALAGAVQNASDSTSITNHGPVSFTSTNNSLIGEPDALNVAEWIVGRNKDVVVRIVGFTVHPHSDPSNLWPEVLSRELLELVTVKVNPPGAGTNLDQLVAVESIQHSVTPGEWVTTYTCFPLSTFDTTAYWILGTADDLDTNTVLA